VAAGKGREREREEKIGCDINGRPTQPAMDPAHLLNSIQKSPAITRGNFRKITTCGVIVHGLGSKVSCPLPREREEERKKMYVVIDGLGSKVGRAHSQNSAQMNSEPVGRERKREREERERGERVYSKGW